MTQQIAPEVEAASCSRHGSILLEQRECRAALDHFQRAVRLGEPPALHLCERWTCLMLLGDFEQAWRESDLAEAWFPRPVPKTFGRLVIRCLRGLGDAIQFLRYIPLLRPRCRRIEVEAPAGLLPLLACTGVIDELVPMGLTAPLNDSAGDCQVECSDLPYLFRTTLDTIPQEAVFQLPTHPLKLESDRLKVGLVWASGDWNTNRSIRPETLEPLKHIPQLSIYSLQRSPQGAAFAPPELPWLQKLEPREPSILATAAAIAQLDLVISVDTMVAHLAASMRTPVWLLLTHPADWRWMLGRTDTPWYRTMRLFRQKPHDAPCRLGEQLVSAITAASARLNRM